MPVVMKIVPVGGRAGIVLDVPLEMGSVTIYTDEELSAVIDGERRDEREACAKIADERAATWPSDERWTDIHASMAAAIRARK